MTPKMKALPQLERVRRAIELLDSGDARCRDIAAWVRRTGIVTNPIYMKAVALIRVCGICGRKAIYRWGLEGRCSTHRLIKTEGSRYVSDQQEKAGSEIYAARKRADYAALSLGKISGRQSKTEAGLRNGR